MHDRSLVRRAAALLVLAALLIVAPGVLSAGTDADGVPDGVDNCWLTPNGPFDLSNQVDTDLDGYGNVCDADYNGDNLITTVDYPAIFDVLTIQGEGALVGSDLVYDHDGDGALTLGDFFYFESAFRGVRAHGE